MRTVPDRLRSLTRLWKDYHPASDEANGIIRYMNTLGVTRVRRLRAVIAIRLRDRHHFHVPRIEKYKAQIEQMPNLYLCQA